MFGNLYFYLQFQVCTLIFLLFWAFQANPKKRSLQGVEEVTKEYRFRIFTVLSIAGAIGCLTLLLLKQIDPTPTKSAEAVGNLSVVSEKLPNNDASVRNEKDCALPGSVKEADLVPKTNPLAASVAAFTRCFTLIKTKKMLLLCLACFYTGKQVYEQD